jgi:hypothetical protein
VIWRFVVRGSPGSWTVLQLLRTQPVGVVAFSLLRRCSRRSRRLSPLFPDTLKPSGLTLSAPLRREGLV